jgi:Mg-chelatase subunit ChlD
MKKRILSLVLCAAMLLSMCLFLGAGVTEDTSDTPAESTAAAESTATSPAVGPILPLVMTHPQSSSPYRAARAASFADANETPLDDGLKLEKTVTPNANGGYTVHLEAYTTGTVTTTTTTKPCDIVLVLDQSGSMADDFDGNTRQHAMQQAVDTFIENVATKARDEEVEHRIAIVKFAGKSTDSVGDDTYNDGGNRYNYSQIVKELTPVNDADGANATALTAAVDKLTARGGTQIQNGLNHAQRLLNGVDSARDSSKVVIVFTDGMPGDGDFDASVATNAIASAKTLKDGGVTVYTVGIFTGANPDEMYGASGFDTNSNGTVNSKWVKDTWGLFPGTDFPEADRPAGNRFLNLLSSNFEDAAEVGLKRETKGLGVIHYKITYTITQNFNQTATGYYKNAADSASLKNIFTSISQTIGSANIDLGSSTVIKDIVTPYFTVPETPENIRLYTADYNGNGSFDGASAAPASVKATIDSATRAVNVTGFDFNQYYVSENVKTDGTRGKKLIIEFDVAVTDGFLGGNQVPTNDEKSGIYPDGTMIKPFTVPTQDVQVNSIAPTADDKAIYLGETADLAQLVHTDYAFDSTNNAYVDVIYTVKDADDNELGTYTVLAGATTGTWEWKDAESSGTVAPKENTTYTVTCTVSPTQVGTQQAVSSEPVPFTITVNTCSLTISKKVTGQNNGQSFVFTVKDTNGNVITTVAVKGGASKTITGLPIGTYTVTEDTQWSWQYDLTSGNDVKKELKANAAEDHATAEFTNAYKGTNWLTSFAEVINKWVNDGKKIDQVNVKN